MAPPGHHYAANVDAKKEGEQAGQFHCSSSPIFVLLLGPLSATLNVLIFVKNGHAAVGSGGVWAFPTFSLVHDITGAEKPHVLLVVHLHQVVEEEKEEREPEHPLDGEVKGSHLAPEEAGVDQGLAPGPNSFPGGSLHFVSLRQDQSNPESCFSNVLY